MISRPAAPELLSPVPHSPDSFRGLKVKIALTLLLLAAALALAYLCHTVLMEIMEMPPLFVLYLMAAALLLLALLNLGHYRRRWHRLRELEKISTAAAHLLPRRRPGRHCYHHCFSSPLDFPLALLGVLSLPLALASGSSYFLLSLLMALAPPAERRLPRKSWQRWRCGYEPADDSFYLARANYLGRYRQIYRWPAAQCGGLYPEGPLLWLAGPAGGEDVLLAEMDYWHRSNERAALALATSLSAASGLPLLHRWPAPPVVLPRRSGPIR